MVSGTQRIIHTFSWSSPLISQSLYAGKGICSMGYVVFWITNLPCFCIEFTFIFIYLFFDTHCASLVRGWALVCVWIYISVTVFVELAYHHHRLYSSVRVLASLKSRLLARLLLGFVTTIFTVWGFQPQAQPPTWRTRVRLLVWVSTFDLSGKGDPASSYATAGIALRIIWPRKPHHYLKVGIPSVGRTCI
jgi:hypothetical protein